MPGGEDAVLVRRALAGDAAAYGVIVDEHRGRVFSLALRMLGDRAAAEDVASEAFLRAWDALPRYDPAKSFATWVLTIASRLCLDALRRRRWRGDPPTEDRVPAAPEPGPEAAVVMSGLAVRVRDAIAQLPERERMAVMLRHLEDMSYAEVAAAMGIPVGTAKTLAFQGRRKLAALLEDPDEERES
jgi:RNA polymerase sigma-70 factor (ECF subfamily)